MKERAYPLVIDKSYGNPKLKSVRTPDIVEVVNNSAEGGPSVMRATVYLLGTDRLTKRGRGGISLWRGLINLANLVANG